MIVRENEFIFIPKSMVRDRRLTPKAKELAVHLYDLGEGDCDMEVLRKRTGMSKRTFDSAVERLLHAGYVEKTEYGYYFRG